MSREKKLWIAFSLVIISSFIVLLYFGYEIYQKAPPLPSKIVNTEGNAIIEGQDIRDGQNVWQSMGGQEVGSIWGHGAYLAPDWTADYIHREALFILNKWSERDFGKLYSQIDNENRAALESRLQDLLRKNTYNPKDGTITLSPIRVAAFEYLQNYYKGLFMDNPELDELRAYYAIPENSIKDVTRMKQMSSFFFWASWACITERPGEKITYTHNWPPDKLVGNEATGNLLIWTGVSIILLLVSIGIMIFYHVRTKEEPNRRPIDAATNYSLNVGSEKIHLGSSFFGVDSNDFWCNYSTLWS